MTEQTQQQKTLDAWIGHDLVDESGDKIGSVDTVYVDEQSGQPDWIAVNTGLFGMRTSFVPVVGLSSSEDVLVSPWDKTKVKDAPNVDPDGRLSAEDEATLYSHYGVEPTSATSDTAGGGTDSAMTRSEEELRVGTTQHETGRARLRKFVETEHRTVTVPVRKERVEVVREPIDETNVDAAMSGSDLTEDQHEVVLTEEAVAVDKQVVPKERVRLDKDVVTEEQQVDADVRKEHIDVEGDVDPAQKRR